MYENIGQKVKGLAVFLFVVGLIISIVAGIVFIDNGSMLLGLVCIVIGAIVSWAISCIIYAIGDTYDELTYSSVKIYDELIALRRDLKVPSHSTEETKSNESRN